MSPVALHARQLDVKFAREALHALPADAPADVRARLEAAVKHAQQVFDGMVAMVVRGMQRGAR